uniref:Down syndrome cell adhesion molecule-like protein Dscam2 n=1 Tax=Strigamia maritima TaxID=126957 RepID=T1IHT8_STRMM
MTNQRWLLLLFLEFTLFYQLGGLYTTNGNGLEGPIFTQEPDDIIEFSNSSGVQIDCNAEGTPQPTLGWQLADGSSISNITNLRLVYPNGTLLLPPFKAEEYRQDVHTATYKCTASNLVGTIFSRDVAIRAVTIQPFDVYVYNVYIIRGNTAVIRCHVPSFLTEYVEVLSWIRDGAFTIQVNGIEKEGKYAVLPSGELLLKNAGPEDAQTTFRCQARHKLTKEIKTSVSAGKLFVTEPEGNVPPRMLIHQTSVVAEEGHDAIIPCVSNGHPVPEEKWYSSLSSVIKPINEDARYKIVQGALIIIDVQQYDAGKFICESTNGAGTQQMETELIVFGRLFATITPPIAVIDIGHKTTFNCEVTGYPIKNIQWLKDGKQVSHFENQLNKNNATLTVKSVSAADKGMYQCFVKNDFDVVHASARLKLGDSPPEFLTTFEEKTLRPKESLSILCEATGTPTPDISWTLDGMAVRGNSQKESADSIISWLNITSLKVENGGVYTCHAKNRKGSVEYSTRIYVHGKLEARSRPKISAISGDTVWLNCPIYGYPFDTLTWEKGDDILPAHLRQVILKNGTLRLENVQRGRDEGRYICSVRNNNGESARGYVDINILVPPKITPFFFQEDVVRQGSRARLQCVVSDGDTPMTIKWLKDGSEISKALGITIREIDEYSSILMIPAINPQHNGNYTCVAINKAANTHFTTKLAVNVAPQIVPFSFAHENIYEGVLVRVSCVVFQGDLPLDLTWFKDDVPVTTQSDIKIRVIDEHSSILTINNVSSRHAGKYTCSAKNGAAETNHTAILTVNVPPIIVPFTFQDEHLLEGMLVRVTCVVSRGDLPMRITWLKDGDVVPKELVVTIRDFDEYSSVLSIDPLSAHHNGKYTCTATNHAGFANHTAELRVNVPPHWVIKPQDMHALVGSGVIIDCMAEGFPKPTIQWMKTRSNNPNDQRDLVATNGHIQILQNGSLRIPYLSEHNEGYYFCHASNGIGDGLSKAMYLKIYRPTRFIFKNNNKSFSISEKIHLICEATGDLPITFNWKLNNKTLDIHRNLRFQLRSKENATKNSAISELFISKAKKNDSNTYVCIAKNDYGSDETNFHVTILDVPDPPVLIEVKSSGNGSNLVKWQIPQDGSSPITHFLLQYKEKKTDWNLSQNLSLLRTRNWTLINDLKPYAFYDIRLAAANSIGYSNFSNDLDFQTEEQAPSGPPLNVEIEPVDKQSLRITWKQPEKKFWNGVIRGYRIGYKVSRSDSTYTFISIEIPEDYTDDLIYQLTELDMYTQYMIIVQAYNGKGNGPPTEELHVMTSEDVPSVAPYNIRCSPLSTTTVYIIWDPISPDYTNGILRGYKVFYKPFDDWYDAAYHSKSIDVPKLTLQGLEVNTNYSIEVAAFTKVGEGSRSHPIYCKTHEDVPSAPGDIKVLSSSSDAVLVTWKPPLKPNGAITKYNVYVRAIDYDEEIGAETRYSKDAVPKPGGVDDTDIHTSRDDLVYQITGLDKNQRYEFWITAVSGVGEGPRSKVVNRLTGEQTIPAQTAAFDDVIKTPWKKDLKLNCRAVGSPQPTKSWIKGGKTITPNERAQLGPDGTLVIQRVDLEDSGNYTCKVQNKYGNDEVKYLVVVLVPPSAPNLGVYSKTMSSLQLKWHQGSNGGDPVRGYMLYYRKDGDKWEKKELFADQDSFMLENLACGAVYNLYMESINNIGVGESSDVVTITTDGDALEPPTKEDLIHEGNTYFSVHLDAWPSSGCPIKNFTIEYRKADTVTWTMVKTGVKPIEKRIVVSGLTPATFYHVRVTAFSNGGPTVADYITATRTSTGGTMSPSELEHQEGDRVIWLSLDWILITASIVLAMILVVVVVTLICIKRWTTNNQKSAARKSHHMSVESFVHLQGNNPTNSRVYASLKKGTLRKDYNLSPYASSTLPGCSPDIRSQGRLSVPTGAHSGKSSTDLMWLDPSTRPLSDNMNYPQPSSSWSQHELGSPKSGSKRHPGSMKDIQARPLPPTPQRNKTLPKKGIP